LIRNSSAYVIGFETANLVAHHISRQEFCC
jgi:hypothetical protein